MHEISVSASEQSTVKKKSRRCLQKWWCHKRKTLWGWVEFTPHEVLGLISIILNINSKNSYTYWSSWLWFYRVKKPGTHTKHSVSCWPQAFWSVYVLLQLLNIVHWLDYSCIHTFGTVTKPMKPHLCTYAAIVLCDLPSTNFYFIGLKFIYILRQHKTPMLNDVANTTNNHSLLCYSVHQARDIYIIICIWFQLLPKVIEY